MLQEDGKVVIEKDAIIEQCRRRNVADREMNNRGDEPRSIL